MATCFRNPEAIPLRVELVHELGDFPSYLGLEGQIQAVFLGIEDSMEKGDIAGIVDSVGTDIDWRRNSHVKVHDATYPFYCAEERNGF